MNWRQRVGIALAGSIPDELVPKLPKQKKEKLHVQELGASLLNLDMSLTTESKVSSKLMQSFEGWVYANVSVLAEEISKMEFQLYQVGLKRGEIVYNEINSHALLDLLDRWNPFTTTSEAMYMIEAHLELGGDTFLLLDNPNKPKNMFILPPDKVTVNPGNQQDGYNVKNYEYRPNTKNNKEVITYEPEYIIQVKNPDPNNPYRGKSVVAAAALAIDTDNLAGEFIKQVFRNGATLSFALSSDQRINRDDLRRIETDLKNKFTGLRNAWKIPIFGGGLTPVTIQQTSKELQFLEIQHAMRDKIMALFKNTPASLGIIEDVNRANAEATLLSWKESTIRPKMQRIVDTLNEFLVPRFGQNLVLTFKDPVPENREDDIAQVKEIMSNNVRQVMTINEARDILGLDPIVGEEFDTISADQAPVIQLPSKQQIPTNLKNIKLTSALRRSGVYEQAAMMKGIYADARKMAEKIYDQQKKQKAAKSKPRYRDVDNEKALSYWTKQVRIAEVIEKRFVDRINTFIEGLEEKTIKNLHAIVPKKYKANRIKAVNPFDVDDEIEAGINLFTPLVEEISQLAGSEAYQLLGLKTLYSPSQRLRERISKAVEEFTESFVKTDRDKLVDILEGGINEGLAIPQIERAIRDQFDSYRKNQSEKIARTETIRASNQGAIDAFRESGVVEGKQWMTAADERVDDECVDLDGVIVGLSGKFFSADFGSGNEPPIHPNCRCVVLPVLVEDEKSATLDLKKELEETKQYAKELEKIAGVDDAADSKA